MELTLSHEDLKREHQKLNPSQTRFKHFTRQAQRAIRLVGRARYEAYGGDAYNAIYPEQDQPKQKP